MKRNLSYEESILKFNRSKFRLLKHRKLIVPAACVGIVVSIATVVMQFLPSNSFYSPKKPISVKEMVDAGALPIQLQTAVPTLVTSDSDSLAVLDGSGEQQNLPQVNETESVMGPAILAILEKVEYRLKESSDAFLYFEDRLENLGALEPQIVSSIALQSTLADMMETRLMEIESRVDSLAQTLSQAQKSESPKDILQPPFRLIAIDRWQNKWNAVIELDGRISIIEPQSSRAGWQLLTIDPSSQSTLFRSRSGKEVKLEIDG